MYSEADLAALKKAFPNPTDAEWFALFNRKVLEAVNLLLDRDSKPFARGSDHVDLVGGKRQVVILSEIAGENGLEVTPGMKSNELLLRKPETDRAVVVHLV